MEMNNVRNGENGEKRRRKVVSRPILVRSVKAGQYSNTTYSREESTTSSIWKNP